MAAKYILRLDDACPTMNASKWNHLESILDHFDIKPIVAVVPDNQDPTLNVDSFDPLFWDKVRSWQLKGWTIAMHGYQHLMHKTDSKLVLPFYQRSEFAGLTYDEQAYKLRQSWQLFLSQDVEPTAWIAPAHCFDTITLKALYDVTPIRTISDGLALAPFYEKNLFWIPQQLWDFAERRSGLWTICLHPNSMSTTDIHELFLNIQSRYSSRIISCSDVSPTRLGKTLQDRLFSQFFWKKRYLLLLLSNFRSYLHKIIHRTTPP